VITSVVEMTKGTTVFAWLCDRCQVKDTEDGR
jgi:hypothetical protein